MVFSNGSVIGSARLGGWNLISRSAATLQEVVVSLLQSLNPACRTGCPVFRRFPHRFGSFVDRTLKATVPPIRMAFIVCVVGYQHWKHHLRIRLLLNSCLDGKCWHVYLAVAGLF